MSISSSLRLYPDTLSSNTRTSSSRKKKKQFVFTLPLLSNTSNMYVSAIIAVAFLGAALGIPVQELSATDIKEKRVSL
jgi:hypothetical protein